MKRATFFELIAKIVLNYFKLINNIPCLHHLHDFVMQDFRNIFCLLNIIWYVIQTNSINNKFTISLR